MKTELAQTLTETFDGLAQRIQEALNKPDMLDN